MELRQIRHFLAVADEGSLGRASKVLDISQPALSKSIQRLEETLRATLFLRTPRGTMLTKYGASFLDHARVMDLEAKSAELEITTMLDGGSAGLTLGISPSLARHIVPRACASVFGSAHAGHVNVVTGMLDDMLRKIRTGVIDFAICAAPPNFDDADFDCRYLADDEMKIVAGTRHPLRRHGAVQLDDLLKYYWILPSGSASGRGSLHRSFLRVGLTPPASVIDSDSIAFICAFLQSTEYLSFLPLSLISRGPLAQDIVGLSVLGHQWKRKIAAISLKRAVLPPIFRALVSEIAKVLHQEQAE